MPKIGEVVKGYDAGFNSPKKVMWCACIDCEKERWVFLKAGQPQSKRCHPCGAEHRSSTQDWQKGKFHHNWKGGRVVTSAGYIQVVLETNHPLHSMTDKRGRVFEHRLVMAQAIGRPLASHEVVHHINGDKQDNRTENLWIMSRESHSSINGLKGTNTMQLQARIKELEYELLRYKQRYGDL